MIETTISTVSKPITCRDSTSLVWTVLCLIIFNCLILGGGGGGVEQTISFSPISSENYKTKGVIVIF